MDKTLKQLFLEHKGKVSDKWSLYLDEWDRLFAPYRDQKIRLLEVGIQNGGSLDVWGVYFSKAEKIIGCDIDQKCGYLRYDDDRISVIIGDANADDCQGEIIRQSPAFDIIIDDGSHKSSDIVRSFARYFPYVNEGGVYVVEDIHASYWEKFEGGLHNPLSAMAFFKRLSDVVNYEHWRNNKSRASLFARFSEKLDIRFDDLDLTRIHSVEFVNSLCIIKKASPEKNLLGRRIVVGKEEHVTSGSEKLIGTVIQDLPVAIKDDASLDIFELIQQVSSFSQTISDREQAIHALAIDVSEKDLANQALAARLLEKDQANQVLADQLLEKDQAIQALTLQLSEKAEIINQNDKVRNQREKELGALQLRLNEREQVLQALNAKLWEIYGSRAWRIVRALWTIRLRLVPHGSGMAVFISRLKRYLSKILSGKRSVEADNAANKLLQPQSDAQIPAAATITRDEFDPTKLISVSPIPERANSPIPAHQDSVDIIVCIHDALDDVVRCLDSIVTHTSLPYHLIIVNDGSQVETSEYLEDFARLHSATTLITNSDARGYTRAANQGLLHSSAEYILLLNSDTIVSGEWLDRMCACVDADPKTGIVGPLSNTASWQSIPEIFENGDWAANPLPDGLSVESMANMLAKNSARLYPEVQLLNGFCLLLRHQLLEDIGLFDEDLFGDGYGEEDDYVFRARAKGWKLALADDVYIYHAQSRSYSHERRKQLTARAGKALAEKHGQEIINTSCASNLNSSVLEGIRSRSKVMVERENLISQGQKEFGGKRILFGLPVALAGGGANVVFSEAAEMIEMGVDVRIFNLDCNRNSFHDSYPDLAIPVTFGNEADFASLARLYDAAIATVYFSVEWLIPLQELKDRPILGYYVQGFEPLIFPPNTTEYNRALASYALIPGIVPFTKTFWTREQVLNNTGIACSPVGVSVDVDLFRPRSRDESIDRPVVISAMIRPETLYREPILTMQVLKKISQMYGSHVEIKIFGTTLDNPDFGKMPLDFPWKLAGLLNPSQVAAFFNETDIFVDFSSHQAMGLTALEAMACGNAVVVPEIGGAIDYASNGENCLIVNTLSFDACLAAVQSLIDNRELFTKIQKNAIRDVCAFYPTRPAYNILKTLFPGV